MQGKTINKLQKYLNIYIRKEKIAETNPMRKANVKKCEENAKRNQTKEFWLSILVGAITGFINGVFGGGGGMVVVPMLRFILKYSEKQAHATAILIILPLSIASGLFYSAYGKVDVGVFLPVAMGVVVGGIVGALLLKKLSAKWVSVIFCLVMAAAGAKMLFF